MRDIAFGPIVLRLVGDLAAVHWARSLTDVETTLGAATHVVHTQIVDALLPVTRPTINAGPWLAEACENGMRFALVFAPGRVVAEFVWTDSMVLRVVREFVGVERHAWFDVLVQLVTCELAATYQGLVLHAAAVTVAGKAVLLCGRSGAGKTTLGARLIRAGAQPLSHDRTMVFRSGTWRAVSTPWGHDGVLAGPDRERDLGSLIFVEQALQNASEKLGGARAALHVAAVMLGARSSIAAMSEAMHVAERLAREVPCFVVRLTNDDRATAHVLELVG